MFLSGKHRHQIDEKGRIRIPSKFRAAFGENFYIMAAAKGCLFLLPESEAERILLKLDEASYSDDEAQDTMRELFSSTENPQEDKQGRVALTKDHLEHAKINKAIVTIGVGRRAEIWAAEEFDKLMDERKKAGGGIKALAKFGV